MKRKHLITTLAAVLVIGVLIGAAIAYTLLASSITMNFDVKNETPLMWEEKCSPEETLYKNTWYNTTTNMIHFNLSSRAESQAYKIVNYIRFSVYNPGADVEDGDVKAAFSYRKASGFWKSYEDMTFGILSGSYDFAEGEFGKGLEVEGQDDDDWYIEFRIRFWISGDAPTGWWSITLITADYYDIYG
ncbi:MAG: hypothetical protein KAV87_08010 [Desulfobacteraceae bacterium]|nr:hypothetical protein [Desulfobacteraceae bacterium]